MSLRQMLETWPVGSSHDDLDAAITPPPAARSSTAGSQPPEQEAALPEEEVRRSTAASQLQAIETWLAVSSKRLYAEAAVARMQLLELEAEEAPTEAKQQKPKAKLQTPEERVKAARESPKEGQHVPFLKGGKVACEKCGRDYQKNGTKKFLNTACAGARGLSRAEVIAHAKGVRATERYAQEAAEAREAAARTAAGEDDFRPHVVLADPTGATDFRCEVCQAGVDGSNRARMMRRPCPGPPGALPAPSAEVEARRKFERERKRDYLSRKTEEQRRLQRPEQETGSSSSGSAASSSTERRGPPVDPPPLPPKQQQRSKPQHVGPTKRRAAPEPAAPPPPAKERRRVPPPTRARGRSAPPAPE